MIGSMQYFSLAGEFFIEMIEIAAVRMEMTWAPFLLKAAFENCVMFACVGGARDWLDQTHFMLQLWVPKDCA